MLGDQTSYLSPNKFELEYLKTPNSITFDVSIYLPRLCRHFTTWQEFVSYITLSLHFVLLH